MLFAGKLGLTDFTDEGRTAFKPVRQRLVRRHPVTGRKSLFLSAHAGEIEGVPMPEGRMLLLDLTGFATRAQFVYSHRWRVNGFVMWDNRSTMHRGRRFDPNEARDIRQTRLAGDGTTISRRLSFRAPARALSAQESCSVIALPARLLGQLLHPRLGLDRGSPGSSRYSPVEMFTVATVFPDSSDLRRFDHAPLFQVFPSPRVVSTLARRKLETAIQLGRLKCRAWGCHLHSAGL